MIPCGMSCALYKVPEIYLSSKGQLQGLPPIMKTLSISKSSDIVAFEMFLIVLLIWFPALIPEPQLRLHLLNFHQGQSLSVESRLDGMIFK
jgi:hypothetical protein